MASIHRPDSALIYDSPNISLLDIITEKNKIVNKRQILHRLIYIARIAPTVNNKKEIGDYFQNLFRKYVTDFEGDGITGLLLVYPYHVMHILEVSSEALNDIIKEQELSETNNTAVISNTKALTLISDVSYQFEKIITYYANRMFSYWSYHILEMPAIQVNDLANANSNEPIDVMVLQCLRAITKLSKHLVKVPEINLHSAIDVLVEKSPGDLYPQSDIEVLLRSNELCGAVEYQEKYYAPLNIILDEEVVWPMPRRIFPPN
ncbi:Uncharacterized protein C7orf62-like protein [Trichoplax sp. H2]|nr:Uncharacterized protein C7orf62-like protein [Trichoplax sp. H2]|eukprot:RDD43921.1 Uncharacterized protein C7orf62-like protein [Trichoplax sp. H2]